MVEAVRISKERVERLEAAIEEFVPTWSLAPIVQALQALRGVDLIVAVTFATEIGDLRRFDSPRQLMGYLGLVPSERSTGDTVRRGGIAKLKYDASDSLSGSTKVMIVIRKKTKVVKTLLTGWLPVISPHYAKFRCKLAAGIYTWTVVGADPAGNTSAPSAPKRLTVKP